MYMLYHTAYWSHKMIILCNKMYLADCDVSLFLCFFAFNLACNALSLFVCWFQLSILWHIHLFLLHFTVEWVASYSIFVLFVLCVYFTVAYVWLLWMLYHSFHCCSIFELVLIFESTCFCFNNKRLFEWVVHLVMPVYNMLILLHSYVEFLHRKVSCNRYIDNSLELIIYISFCLSNNIYHCLQQIWQEIMCLRLK